MDFCVCNSWFLFLKSIAETRWIPIGLFLLLFYLLFPLSVYASNALLYDQCISRHQLVMKKTASLDSNLYHSPLSAELCAGISTCPETFHSSSCGCSFSCKRSLHGGRADSASTLPELFNNGCFLFTHNLLFSLSQLGGSALAIFWRYRPIPVDDKDDFKE